MNQSRCWANEAGKTKTSPSAGPGGSADTTDSGEGRGLPITGVGEPARLLARRGSQARPVHAMRLARGCDQGNVSIADPGVGIAGHGFDELLDRSMLEEIAGSDGETRSFGAGRDLKDQKRVPSQVEDVVPDTHPVQPQHFSPDRGERLLPLVARRHER